MKTIKFTCNGNSSPAYNCNKPGDNSGEYVRKEIADEMRFLIIDLQAAMRAVNVVPIVKQVDELRERLGI